MKERRRCHDNALWHAYAGTRPVRCSWRDGAGSEGSCARIAAHVCFSWQHGLALELLFPLTVRKYRSGTLGLQKTWLRNYKQRSIGPWYERRRQDEPYRAARCRDPLGCRPRLSDCATKPYSNSRCGICALCGYSHRLVIRLCDRTTHLAVLAGMMVPAEGHQPHRLLTRKGDPHLSVPYPM